MSSQHYVILRLVSETIYIPRDAVVVIGSRVMVMSTQTKLQQPGLDIVSDLTNFRMYLVAIKEVIRLDWLPLVTARTQGDPVNILSWYDGLATPYYVLCDLGFKIGLYYAIENDAIARATVAHNLPEVTQSSILDAKDVRSHHLPEVEWYAIYGTPPCQMISRRTDNPKYDVSLFRCMGAVNDAISICQQPNIFVEQPIPHEKLQGIRTEWDDIMHMPGQVHRADHAGSMATRERLYWLNSVYMKDMPLVEHRCDAVVFDGNFYPEVRPLQPAMASGDNTECKQWCVQYGTGIRRLLTSDERDRVHPALAAGYSGKTNASKIRNVGNGNALSADVLS